MKCLVITSRNTRSGQSVVTKIEESVVPQRILSNIGKPRPDGLIEDVMENHARMLNCKSPSITMRWEEIMELKN